MELMQVHELLQHLKVKILPFTQIIADRLLTEPAGSKQEAGYRFGILLQTFVGHQVIDALKPSGYAFVFS